MAAMDNNPQAVYVFNKLAGEYQARFMDVSLYADTFDFFCDNIQQPNPQVLELACGPGNITQYLLSKRPDFKLLGTDLAPNMVNLAKINNPTAAFNVMDCRAIDGLNNAYDAIMCGFCLPYMAKPEAEKLISDSAKLLNPHGLLYLSTMEDDHAQSGFRKGSSGDEIFQHFYMAADLTAMLAQSGLTLIYTSRKYSTSPDGKTVTDLILIAQK